MNAPSPHAIVHRAIRAPDPFQIPQPPAGTATGQAPLHPTPARPAWSTIIAMSLIVAALGSFVWTLDRVPTATTIARTVMP